MKSTSKHRTLKKVFLNVTACLTALVVTGSIIANECEVQLNSFLGTSSTKIVTNLPDGVTEEGYVRYYDSKYSTLAELKAAGNAKVREVEGEGIVLMKNENSVLPLAAGAKVSLVGVTAMDPVYGGTGSGAVDAVVVDSVAALVPKQEIEGEMGDTFVGLQARLMSQALRKLAGTIAKTNCVVIFINQLRMKIGVMYGNPETTTGGNALKFYSSVRLDVRRIASLKEGNNVIGNKTRVKVVKNKVAPPFREAVFEILYGKGISKWGELVDLAVQLDIIQKSGSWFSMGDERIGQGANSVKDYLIANPDIAEKVEAEVRENLWKLNNGAPKAPAKAADKAVAVSADDFDDEG